MRNEKRGSLRPPVEGLPTPGYSLNGVLIRVVQKNRTYRNEIYYQELAHVIMEAMKPQYRQAGVSGRPAVWFEGPRATELMV